MASSSLVKKRAVESHGGKAAKRGRESGAAKMPAAVPPPERTIITGILDQLTGSKGEFRLLVGGSKIVKGILPPGAPGEYAHLFSKKVVVDGVAFFHPSGAIWQIVASRIHEASPADAVWERVPTPRARSLADLKPAVAPPPGSNGMDLVFGEFRCEESVEELLAALKDMD